MAKKDVVEYFFDNAHKLLVRRGGKHGIEHFIDGCWQQDSDLICFLLRQSLAMTTTMT